MEVTFKIKGKTVKHGEDGITHIDTEVKMEGSGEDIADILDTLQANGFELI